MAALDNDTGALRIGSLETEIGPGIALEDFERSAAGAAASLWVGTGSHRSYRLEAELGDLPFVVIAWFREDHLFQLTLSCAPDGYRLDWSQWSEERELEIRDLHDRWLGLELGPPTGGRDDEATWRRPWGTVSSYFDPRTAGSSIAIRYTDAAAGPTEAVRR